VALLLHLAVAATATAYETWDPDRPFREYPATLRWCLQRAGHAFTDGAVS
jgi:hypothetical protein